MEEQFFRANCFAEPIEMTEKIDIFYDLPIGDSKTMQICNYNTKLALSILEWRFNLESHFLQTNFQCIFFNIVKTTIRKRKLN